jgi:hypothetical protein
MLVSFLSAVSVGNISRLDKYLWGYTVELLAETQIGLSVIGVRFQRKLECVDM